jgi:rhodanese-related sulfurtransferase
MDPHFDGVIFQTHAAELRRRMGRPFPPFLILDLRPQADFEAGHLPGAVPTSPEALTRGLPQGSGEHTEFIVIGARPGDPAVREASRALMGHGAHRVVELPGGMLEWREAGYRAEDTAAAQAA